MCPPLPQQKAQLRTVRAGASLAWPQEDVALKFSTSADFGDSRCAALLTSQVEKIKCAESKAHKRPYLLCAWHFALRRFTSRSGNLVNFVMAQGTRLPRHPKIKEITNSTRNIKNRSFAMPADAAAIPPNPRTAATSAMIRNNTAQPNISSPPHGLNRIYRLDRASQHASSHLNVWNNFNDLPQLGTSPCRTLRNSSLSRQPAILSNPHFDEVLDVIVHERNCCFGEILAVERHNWLSRGHIRMTRNGDVIDSLSISVMNLVTRPSLRHARNETQVISLQVNPKQRLGK